MVALDAYRPCRALTVSFEGKYARAMHEYSIQYDPVNDTPAKAARRFSSLELRWSQHPAAGSFVAY